MNRYTVVITAIFTEDEFEDASDTADRICDIIAEQGIDATWEEISPTVIAE